MEQLIAFQGLIIVLDRVDLSIEGTYSIDMIGEVTIDHAWIGSLNSTLEYFDRFSLETINKF